jgi:hypothetical protein
MKSHVILELFECICDVRVTNVKLRNTVGCGVIEAVPGAFTLCVAYTPFTA